MTKIKILKKVFFAFIFAFIFSGNAKSQTYNDTLFFKSGMEKTCEIISYDKKNVKYTYTTTKGEVVFPIIAVKQLKYFVMYDSLGTFLFSSKQGITDSTIITEKIDSSLVSRHLISINPMSLGVLGLNTSYTFRFGSNLKFGIHIPLRITSPILFNGKMAFYSGLGLTFFMLNNEKYAMTMDFTPSIYYFGDVDAAFALPITIGFVRYLKPKLAIDGHIGCGPGFVDGKIIPFPIPAAHIGLCFMPGKKTKIKLY